MTTEQTAQALIQILTLNKNTGAALEKLLKLPLLDADNKIPAGVLRIAGALSDGHIIESGDNANGNYVRFADGTQICRKTLPYTIAANSMVSWGSIYAASVNRIHLGEFPAVFVEKPFVNISVSILETSSAASSSSFLVAYSGNELTATSGGYCTLCRGNQLAATLNFDIIVIAIGRWK